MTDEEIRVDINNLTRDLASFRLDFGALCDNLFNVADLARKDLAEEGELNLKHEDIRNCDDYLSKVQFRLEIFKARLERIKLYHFQRENELLQNKELIELRARIKGLEKQQNKIRNDRIIN